MHLERLDTVGELDDLDSAAETGTRNVGADFRQQVTVARSLSGQPYVLEGFLGGNSLGGVRIQESENEIFGILGHIAPVPLMEDDAACSAFFDKVGQVLGSEGGVATQEGIGDDTERPHIDGLAVTLLKHDLGSSISKGAGHTGQYLGGAVQHFRDTEVCQDQLRVGGTGEVQEVLGFQVFAEVSYM